MSHHKTHPVNTTISSYGKRKISEVSILKIHEVERKERLYMGSQQNNTKQFSDFFVWLDFDSKNLKIWMGTEINSQQDS